MAENSNIGWTHSTFNPHRGCTKISAGCKVCYADTLSKRNPSVLGIWGDEGTRVVASESMWKEPLRWNRIAGEKGIRHRVFCASLADIFEDWKGQVSHSSGVPMWRMNKPNGHAYHWAGGKVLDDPNSGRPLTLDDVRRRLFHVIDATPNLDWLLLTKRPENIRKMWPAKTHYLDQYTDDPFPNSDKAINPGLAYYRSNVWLGCSTENQEYADKRIPELLKCRGLSPVLFLSCEPLLGPIDLSQCKTHEGNKDVLFVGDEGGYEYAGSKRNFINWIIDGAESGQDRRPANVEWFRSLRDQCRNAGVPFFHKQMEVGGKVTDNMDEFPIDLRIQEFPIGRDR